MAQHAWVVRIGKPENLNSTHSAQRLFASPGFGVADALKRHDGRIRAFTKRSRKKTAYREVALGRTWLAII